MQFLGRAVTGDFGSSSITEQVVLREIARALPATVELSVVALILAVGLGIPLGYLAAANRGRPLDAGTVIGTLVGVAVPVFFLGYERPALRVIEGAPDGSHRVACHFAEDIRSGVLRPNRVEAVAADDVLADTPVPGLPASVTEILGH